MKKKVCLGVLALMVLIATGMAVVRIAIPTVFGGSLNPFKDGINVYSSGWRTGYVLKCSEKGNLAKTYEGQLLVGYDPRGIDQGGVANGAGQSNVWPFSVVGDTTAQVVADLHAAAIANPPRRVVLHYQQLRVSTVGQDTDYNVVRVELVPEPTNR